MADLYNFNVATGVIVPDTSTILISVQSEYQSTFGMDLPVTPDTPQGMLIVAEALPRTAVVNNNAQQANQINPNVSVGTYLDAIMALTGQERLKATHTLVTGVIVAGIPATLIPAGSQAQTDAGDLFETLSDVTLDGSGNGTVNFQSVETGPISCNVADLINITDNNVLGWETVTNPNAGALGRDLMGDVQARAYRNNTLAFQGVALIEAITSAIYAVPNVISMVIRENVQTTTQSIDGISLVAKSIWVCVQGGLDLDIGAALLENKSGGCNWNGAVTQNLIEPTSGQPYAVKFARPTNVPVLIKVYTVNGSEQNVKDAVVAYINGLVPGVKGFVIGNDVSPFEISAAVINQNPGYFISKVEVTLASSPGSFSTNPIVINIDQLATANAASVTVVVG